MRAGGETKTKRARRTLELPALCVDALREHRRRQLAQRIRLGERWLDNDLEFATQYGTELDAANVRRAFRKVAAAAGMEASEWTPRELRHRFVSLLSSLGVPIEDIAHLVGHANTKRHREELAGLRSEGRQTMTDTTNDMAAAEQVPAEPVTPVDQQQHAERLVAQAKEQGVELVGPDGLLNQLTKSVLETALEAEISEHLGYDKHHTTGRNHRNSRNGVRSKTVLTEIGPVEIEVPRDVNASFTPQIVRKRQRWLAGVDGAAAVPRRARPRQRRDRRSQHRPAVDEPCRGVPRNAQRLTSWRLTRGETVSTPAEI